MVQPVDLWVHYRPEGGLPKQIKQRKATDAEVIARLRQVEGVEPDYEAAEALFGDDLAWIVEACGDNRDGPNLAVDALVKRVVDAALAGRLVVPVPDSRKEE